MGYDFTNVQDDFGLIAGGEYEAIIEKVELKQYSTGTEYINLQIRIREDFEQEHKNRVVFDKILKEKDTQVFNRQRLTRLLRATVPNDTPLKFDTLDEILDTIHGKKVRVVVSQRYNEFFDEDENFIYYYKPSSAPDKELTPKQSEPPTTEPASSGTITNTDEVPF